MKAADERQHCAATANGLPPVVFGIGDDARAPALRLQSQALQPAPAPAPADGMNVLLADNRQDVKGG